MRSVYLAGTAVAAALACGPALAQDFQQGAPKQLPTQTPRIEQAPAVPPAIDDRTVVVPMVKGVTFVPAVKFVPGGPAMTTSGVTVVRVPKGAPGVDLDVVDTKWFRARAAQLIGKPATIGDLNALSRATIAYYRAQHHPLVDVRVPEQDVSSGVIQIVISEYRVDQVDVRGVKVVKGRVELTPAPRFFDPKLVRKGLRLKRGSRIVENRIVEDLNWLSANPFRRVDLIYRRSDEVGYTDITERVTERRPIRVYVGYENTGTVNTQRDRYSAGFNWGNVFKWDHQLSYQFTASQNWFSNRPGNPDPSFISHSFTYQAPLHTGLPYHDTFILFGTYQRAAPALGGGINQVGKNYQLSGRYTVQLPSAVDGRQQIALGYDYKQTNNNLLFGGASVSNVTTDIHQAVIEYAGSRLWRLTNKEDRTEGAEDRATTLTFSIGDTLTLSPGGIGHRNTDTAFRPSTAGPGTPFAKSNYAYNRLTVGPSVRFSNGIEASSRVMWQISTVNLLPSEQLSAAGPSYVRAYDPNSVIGTDGVLANAELRSPVFSLVQKRGKYADRAQVGVFYDYGQVHDKDRLAGVPDHFTTSAAGLTATYGLGINLLARLDYGWQLKDAPTFTKKHELGFVSVTLGF